MSRRIDLFCQVIDNLGDIGVSWRLSRQLAQEYGCIVRLWVDQLTSLKRLEPSILLDRSSQLLDGVEVLHWNEKTIIQDSGILPEVVICAFSCDLPEPYRERMREQHRLRADQTEGTQQQALVKWIALEYLSAQPWVEGFHLQTSLKSDGLKLTYFFPGFTDQTGGLIREQVVRHNPDDRGKDWLLTLDIPKSAIRDSKIISVFTYPDAPLDQLVIQLEHSERRSLLLIPRGVRTRLEALDPQAFTYVRWQTIPFLTQQEYDRLLACADLNLVRGEDSFVRAIWAGKPFVWHIYPQEEGEHHKKLQAWLALAAMPDNIAKAMHQWSRGHICKWTDLLTAPDWLAWRKACLEHRNQLLGQKDLAKQLLELCDTSI